MGGSSRPLRHLKPKKELFKEGKGEKGVVCNKCESIMEEDPYQSILEIDPAGKKKEDGVATGLKAEVGRLTAELTKARAAVLGLQVVTQEVLLIRILI